MLFSLIYFSKAVNPMHSKELVWLLEESRDWNITHSLTGMLLYIRGDQAANHHKAGRFIQVLEGPEEEVRGIFEKIRQDKRHYGITILNEAMIKKRNFETWLMGFEAMDLEAYKLVPGFFELDEGFVSSGNGQKMNVPLNFLKSFYMTLGSSKDS